jgi:hypothetical protein
MDAVRAALALLPTQKPLRSESDALALAVHAIFEFDGALMICTPSISLFASLCACLFRRRKRRRSDASHRTPAESVYALLCA